MKRGWRMGVCALTVLGVAAVARADIAAPPNDYTGFLYRGRHYFSVLPEGGFGKLVERHPGLPGWLALGFLVFCGWSLVCLVATARAQARGTLKPLGQPHRRSGWMEWGVVWGVVGLLLLWGLAAAWETLVAKPGVWGSAWPPMLYFDTPKLRAEYDQECIDWYNAHRGDSTGEHSYRYWRGIPKMRPGAPEAVTNAFEAFRKSLREGNPNSQKVSESIMDNEWKAQ